MAFKVFPYKQGSKSAKALANELDGKVLKIEGSKYRPKRGDFVVNWGSGRVPGFGPATVLNGAGAVIRASDKLKTFDALHAANVSIPLFTADREVAQGWANEGVVVCRTVLRGHSGEGIVIATDAEEVVRAPLYTKYVKKKDEYRVHVLRNQAFFIQRKARKLDVENPNWQVRNLAGGFVFAEVAQNEVPRDVIQQAVASIAALGLDFGGVDVMWNDREQKAYVLEVNTACGLEERTAGRYAETFVRTFAN